MNILLEADSNVTEENEKELMSRILKNEKHLISNVSSDQMTLKLKRNLTYSFL